MNKSYKSKQRKKRARNKRNRKGLEAWRKTMYAIADNSLPTYLKQKSMAEYQGEEK